MGFTGVLAPLQVELWGLYLFGWRDSDGAPGCCRAVVLWCGMLKKVVDGLLGFCSSFLDVWFVCSLERLRMLEDEFSTWTCMNMLEMMIVTFLGHLWRVLLHFSEKIPRDRPSLTKAKFCLHMCAVYFCSLAHSVLETAVLCSNLFAFWMAMWAFFWKFLGAVVLWCGMLKKVVDGLLGFCSSFLDVWFVCSLDRLRMLEHEFSTWTCMKMLEMMIVTFLGHLWRVLLHFSEKIPRDRPSLTKAKFCLHMCAVYFCSLAHSVLETAVLCSNLFAFWMAMWAFLLKVLGCCRAVVRDAEESCGWLAWVLFIFPRLWFVCSLDRLRMLEHEFSTWTCMNMLEMMIVTFLGHLWRVLLHFSEKIPRDRPSLTKTTCCLCMCAVYFRSLAHSFLETAVLCSNLFVFLMAMWAFFWKFLGAVVLWCGMLKKVVHGLLAFCSSFLDVWFVCSLDRLRMLEHEFSTWTCMKMLEMMIVTFLGHLWRVLLHFSEKIPRDRPSLTKATCCLYMCAVYFRFLHRAFWTRLCCAVICLLFGWPCGLSSESSWVLSCCGAGCWRKLCMACLRIVHFSSTSGLYAAWIDWECLNTNLAHEHAWTCLKWWLSLS